MKGLKHKANFNILQFVVCLSRDTPKFKIRNNQIGFIEKTGNFS